MFTLALETSGLHGSVAVLRAGTLVREVALREDQRSAQCLTIALRELLEAANVSAKEISLIAVAHGPGSFTGLRVGLMAAKALAYAWRCDVVGVDTLQAIARQVQNQMSPSDGQRLWAVIDAQRQQLFAAAFEATSNGCRELLASTVLSREDWLNQLQASDLVSGLGLKPLLNRLPPQITVAAESTWQPRAAAVGEIGWQIYQDPGQSRSWQGLAPHYLRGSAAEENPKYQR